MALFSRDRIIRRGNCVEWPPRAGQTRVTLAHFKISAEQSVLELVMIPPRSMNFSGLGGGRKLGRPVSSGLGRLSGHAAEMAALPTEEDTKRREHELLSLEPPEILVERLHFGCKRERAVRTG